MAQGFVMLMFAVFGLLAIGIIYQSMQMLKGKSFMQIIAEVKQAFGAIFK